MRWLDWLLGVCEVGWVKTALLAALLGLPLFVLLYPSHVAQGGGGSKYAVIALGYPLLVLARWAYWRRRERDVLTLIASNSTRLRDTMASLARWQPDLYGRYAFQAAAASGLRNTAASVGEHSVPPSASCPYCGVRISSTSIMCEQCAAREGLSP